MLIYLRDIKNKSMSDSKKSIANKDIFAFYVGRPISYFITIPFLKTNITPNQVSILSILPLILGSFFLSFNKNSTYSIVGVILLFLWNLLDGVDGNIARYKSISSEKGSVIDAMSGYLAMYLTYFSVGINAFNFSGNYIYIILGSLSGFFLIFPRLIMHKYENTLKRSSGLGEKQNYGFIKLVALNLTSITGFTQPILLLSVIFDVTTYYTILYFMINLVVMVVSIIKLLTRE